MYSRIGNKKYLDNTPRCVFRNDTAIFQNSNQVLDVNKYANDVVIKQNDNFDAYMTTEIRKEFENLRQTYNIGLLFQHPMYSKEDGTSLLLPLDNELGCDYLTYRDGRYKDFIIDLCDDLVKMGSKEEDAARILLIDYSANAPYASTMRHDGRMALKKGAWPEDSLEIYSIELQRIFAKNFEIASQEKEFVHYAPPKNSTKGIGFFKNFPDGSKHSGVNDLFIPKELSTKSVPIEQNLWALKNRYGIKKAWLDSGALMANTEFFLQNCSKYSDPVVFKEAIRRGACSVHTEAYRTNNGDKTLNSLKNGVRAAVDEGLYKKNRVYSYECSPNVFESGVIDDKRYSKAYRDLNPDEWGTLLKKRPMFPGPNTTFSLPFIMLCRLMLGPLEDSSTGFPSSSDKVLRRYERYFTLFKDEERECVTFDRSTAEQFITDNLESVLKFFRGDLRDIISGILCSVIPSKFGGRFVHALLSGTALTTFLNCVTGLFENCVFTSIIAYGAHWQAKLPDVVKAVMDELLNEGDYVTINGLHFIHNLGTDDQIFYVSGANCRARVKDAIPLFDPDARFLSVETGFPQTVFGLDFYEDHVNVSETLGLAKLFLFEKDGLGDQIALKYHARLLLLDKYYDVIQKNFTKHGFGSLSTYNQGADNFFAQRLKFGFAGYESLYNKYSFTDRLIYGEYIKKAGFDPSTFVDRYSYDELKDFVSLFKGRLFRRY